MKKIFLIIWLFFCFYLYSYANNSIIEADKYEINEKETIKVKIDILSDSNDIRFKKLEINGNFSIIWSSSYSSSSTQITIINWVSKQISQNKISYIFELKPLKTWKIIAWPWIYYIDWKENKTKTINIQVNKNSILTSSEKEVWNNNLFLYIYFTILLILILNIQALKMYRERKEKLKFSNIQTNDVKIENIPKIQFNNFCEDVYYSFLNYLSEKYFIKDIYSKTKSEIIQDIDDNNIDKNEIQELLNFFDKIKYSREKDDKELAMKKIQDFMSKNNKS